MHHRTTEAVFEYFNQLRGRRPAPVRTEIDPGALKSFLPDLFILERARDGIIRFRLAGTRICLILGQEVRNREFGQIWEPLVRHKIKLAADTVLANQNALEIALETVADEEEPMALEMLLLPLCSEVGRCDRLFGSLVAIDAAYSIEAYPRLLTPSDLAFMPVEASEGPRPCIEQTPRTIVASSLGSIVNRITHLRVFEGGKRD